MYYIDTPDAIALLPQSRFGDGVWVVDIKLLSIMEAVFRYVPIAITFDTECENSNETCLCQMLCTS